MIDGQAAGKHRRRRMASPPGSNCLIPELLMLGRPPQDKLGLGKPTENPLFLNIVAPPSFKQPFHSKKPVRIYIHGGFLQFGSPHGLSGQAQYVSAERDEVWVNIGYRYVLYLAHLVSFL
jgi:carboxylesterase type B